MLSFNRFSTINRKRCVEWFRRSGSLSDCNTEEDFLLAATELGGEAGELLNEVKKLYRARKGIAG